MSNPSNKSNLVFNPTWDLHYTSSFYFSSLTSPTKHSPPLLLLLSYDDKLHIYKTSGQKISILPFSSKVTALFKVDLLRNDDPVFVSMDFDGVLRVFSNSGQEIWKKQLPGKILTGAIGNIDFTRPTSELEIVCVLDTKSIQILNANGDLIANYTHPISINACTIGNFHSSTQDEIIFCDYKDQLYSLQPGKEIVPLSIIHSNITALALLRFNAQNYLALADNLGFLSIYDLDGKIVRKWKTNGKVACMTSMHHLEKSVCNLFFAMESDVYMAWEIIEENPQSLSPLSSNNIGELHIMSSDPKTVPSNPKNGELRFKCPSCGGYLPLDFKDQIEKGNDVFCEFCGIMITQDLLQIQNLNKK